MMTKLGIWTVAGALVAAAPAFGSSGEGGNSGSDPSVAGVASAGETTDVLNHGRGDATANPRDEALVHARAPRARSDYAVAATSHRIAAPASDELDLNDEFLRQQRSWTGP